MSDTLKYVGHFRETGYEDMSDAPSLVEARGKRPPAHKDDVLAYLRKAPTVIFSPGVNRDFFNPSQIISGDTMRTDGVFTWPDYLSDYVELYDVELPEAFERHMEARGWRLPEGLDVRTLKTPW